MGFEVLDVGARHGPEAASVPARGHPGADPDVVDLDALPDPPPDDHRSRPAGRTGLTGGRAARARLAIGLVAVLVAGIVAGGAWAGHVHKRQQAAERSATLAVTALTDSWTRVPWTRRPVVDVVVRLLNAGPLPVDVVGSTLGDRPRSTRPYIRPLVGGLTVGRGNELAISVLQRLDCSSSVPVPLTVPVRTADGVVHDVPVRRGGPERLVPRDVCLQDTEELGVTAELAGPLNRPVVELRNPSSGPVVVTVDPLVPADQPRPVLVTTTPGLPVDVDPGATRRLALSIRAPTCVADAAQLQGAGQLALVARSVPVESSVGSSAPERQSLLVDVSTLVGAAVERACR
jgi:hypothetical protein